MAQLENIEAIEKRLWNAADNLRANSNYASNEYFMPVMGLIFLRHAYSRYLAVKDGIEANLPKRGGKARPLSKEDFSQKGAIFLRPEAQFDYLVSLPDSAKRDRAIQHAMDIVAAKETVNENDETRKRFEIMAREAFKKFKACLTVAGINDFRHAYDAINIIYKSLQIDREAADITDIIRALHGLVDEAITTAPARAVGESPRFDFSKIDFERLRKEFERSTAKHSTVQNLKQVIESRLSRLLTHNPLRTDLQRHYEEIVEDYNREKDRVTIESTFAALLKFVQVLDDEESRAMREGLDEESLALFDLLLKPGLEKPDIQRIKKVAAELLTTLKAEKLRIDNWCEKEATRDAVQVTIENFLWDDRTGLPTPAYSEEDVKTKSRDVYRHVHRVYPTIPSPFYTS